MKIYRKGFKSMNKSPTLVIYIKTVILTLDLITVLLNILTILIIHIPGRESTMLFFILYSL